MHWRYSSYFSTSFLSSYFWKDCVQTICFHCLCFDATNSAGWFSKLEILRQSNIGQNIGFFYSSALLTLCVIPFVHSSHCPTVCECTALVVPLSFTIFHWSWPPRSLPIKIPRSLSPFMSFCLHKFLLSFVALLLFSFLFFPFFPHSMSVEWSALEENRIV